MLLRNKESPDIVDARRLEQLFQENYKTMLYTAAAYFSVNAAPCSSASCLAEEAVQETFLTAWEKREELFASESPKGWLFKTMKYIAKNSARAEWTLFRHFAQIPGEAEFPSPEDAYFLIEFQSGFTEDEFRLLKRLYLEGATYQEVSQEMGISKAALAMRIQRIKAKKQQQEEK